MLALIGVAAQRNMLVLCSACTAGHAFDLTAGSSLHHKPQAQRQMLALTRQHSWLQDILARAYLELYVHNKEVRCALQQLLLAFYVENVSTNKACTPKKPSCTTVNVLIAVSTFWRSVVAGAIVAIYLCLGSCLVDELAMTVYRGQVITTAEEFKLEQAKVARAATVLVDSIR